MIMNMGEYAKMSEKEKEEYFYKEYDHMNEYDIKPASDTITVALLNNMTNNKTKVSALKRYLDGEPVNKDPLKEITIPDPEMRLYFIGNNYFQTIDELLQYCRVNGSSTNGLGILEYYRNLANHSDVIKKSSSTTLMLYTAVDEDGYGIYNYERSVYRGKFTWEYNHGNIRKMYKPFRDRGIVFEDDIYAKENERMQHIEQSFQKIKK